MGESEIGGSQMSENKKN